MQRIAALLVAALPAPALAAQIATGAAPGVPWLRLVLSLLLCLAVAFGAVVALKRHQRRSIPSPLKMLLKREGTPQRPISLIETRRASMHGDLCLIEYDGERWLLAFTAAGVTILKGPGASR